MGVLANVRQFLSGTKKDASSKPPYMLEQRSSSFLIILTVGMSVFTDIFYYALVIPVIPFSLAVQVGIPDDQAQRWTSILLACYSVALLVGSPVFGWYADHTSSRRWPLLIGLVMLAGSTLLLCLGNSIALLVVGRLLQGLSAAIVWSVGCALLVDTMGNSVGVAMGYVSIAMSLGLLIAPVIGGAVYEAAGYYAVYYIAFGIVAVDILLRLVMIEKKVAQQWMPKIESTPGAIIPESDVEKAAPLAIGDIVTIAGPSEPSQTTPVPTSNDTTEFSTEQEKPEDAAPGDSGPSSSNTRAVSTSSRRWRKRDAVIMLMKSSRLLAALYGMVVEAGLMMGFDAVLALFLQSTFGWTSTAAGIFFLAIFCPGFVAPAVGWLADRYGARWLSVGGFGATVPLLVCLRFVGEDTIGDKVLLGFLLALLGCAFTFSNTPLMAEIGYVVDALAIEHPGVFGDAGAYGLGYGLWTMSFALGGTVGPLWSGYVLATAGWGTMNWSFAIWAASAAAVAFFGLGPRDRKKKLGSSEAQGSPEPPGVVGQRQSIQLQE